MSGKHELERSLARRLRVTREYLGLSQQFVADKTGISRVAISAIEGGKRKVAGVELQLLAKLYRYPVSYFLGEEPEAEQDPSLRLLARKMEDLTEEDKEEVMRFAEYIRFQGQARRTEGD